MQRGHVFKLSTAASPYLAMHASTSLRSHSWRLVNPSYNLKHEAGAQSGGRLPHLEAAAGVGVGKGEGEGEGLGLVPGGGSADRHRRRAEPPEPNWPSRPAAEGTAGSFRPAWCVPVTVGQAAQVPCLGLY